ncbi:threonine/serine ThrE exporter family protein [Anaerobiospirillum succiniciproducens]|uniref:threonine/serine ThrE exporter family protein n=2 Tax=Anaerobiospirillum succiniciproducens TaxID=13335 RepID=UPI002357CA5E|nr:threonine/serine exporter family protein [Anaerobiospirillum succiniciproducens]MCI6863529.1 threonine/serine exporter family protein [Anaerobiospirillum succiniciproducens]
MPEAVLDDELLEHKHHGSKQLHNVSHGSFKPSHYASNEQPSPCNDEQQMHIQHHNVKGILGRIHDIGSKAIFPEPLESVIPHVARAGHNSDSSHKHHCIEHYNTTDSINIDLQSHLGECHNLLNRANFSNDHDQSILHPHASMAYKSETIDGVNSYADALANGYRNDHSVFTNNASAVSNENNIAYNSATSNNNRSCNNSAISNNNLSCNNSAISNDNCSCNNSAISNDNTSSQNSVAKQGEAYTQASHALSAASKSKSSAHVLKDANGVHLETVEDEALFADTYVTPGSDNEDLALKAKLLSTLGWRMASVGAETRLIVQSVKKMSHDLGCRNIDLSISRDGIMVKLRRGNNIAVDFKEIKHFAINMDSLCRLHQICLRVSNGSLSDPHQIFLAIRAVRPRHYQHKQLIFIEAIAGGCFAYLNGGNAAVCLGALIGCLFLMYYRFLFIRRGFFESFTFMLCACIGSSIAALCCHYLFNGTQSNVMLAATASTLLLVPGFPLINGFLDIFKGHVPIGLNRIVIALVLIVSAAVGLLMTSFIYSSVTAIFG